MAKEKKPKTLPMNEPPLTKPAMKTVGQVVEFLQDKFRFAYQRPLMVGGSAEDLDLVLFNDHQMWAAILGREDDFDRIRGEIYTEVGSQAMGFATFFRRKKPKGSEQELCDLVVAQWKRIDQLLNLPIPD